MLVIERTLAWLRRDRVEGWPAEIGDGIEAPIFVVGYPRSGTTLVEQALSAHPRLVVTGEDPVLYRVKAATPGALQLKSEYPEALEEFTVEDVKRLRRLYVEEARKALGPASEGKRVVEKQPLALVDLPFVRRIFPESPVIMTLRDPRDACLSCFMQDFHRGTPHFYDLGWTAEHYDAVMRLWALQKRELAGLKWMEVRYEDLVERMEEESRRMLAFAGEEWDEGVARYFEKKHMRYVSTPSYADVMKPAYKTSVARWKKYEDRMAGALAILAPHVKELGYE
jgi:hypothetical protein